MFERLGEVYQKNECYKSDDDVPEWMMWEPPRSSLASRTDRETGQQLLDRIIEGVKVGRAELNSIIIGDCSSEEKIIRTTTLHEDVHHLQKQFKECQQSLEPSNSEVNEAITRVKSSLEALQTDVDKLDIPTFVLEILHQYDFSVGMSSLLIPWLDAGEKVANNPLEKPDSFDQGVEIEKACATFAKDVRKVNKLFTKLEASLEKLPANKTTATSKIEAEKIRFKQIASVAIGRVETMRELLQKWNFYLELKNKMEDLRGNLRKIYKFEKELEKSELSDNEFETGLPRILTPWLEDANLIVGAPEKPVNFDECREMQKKYKAFEAEVDNAENLLKKIEECTEKTPAQPEVWEQRCSHKKIAAVAKERLEKIQQLYLVWEQLNKSEQSDNMDCKDLSQFLKNYEACYATVA